MRVQLIIEQATFEQLHELEEAGLIAEEAIINSSSCNRLGCKKVFDIDGSIWIDNENSSGLKKLINIINADY